MLSWAHGTTVDASGHDVDASDKRSGGGAEPSAAKREIEMHREQHAEAGGRAGSGRQRNRLPGPVVQEELATGLLFDGRCTGCCEAEQQASRCL